VTTTDDGLVDCPLLCGRRMTIPQVDAHMDHCPSLLPPAKIGSRALVDISQSPKKDPPAKPKLERLPKLSYSLLKENYLRKKLGELGIPAWGSKQLMERRHTEWVSLWNANTDSLRPKSRQELLPELDSWERSQGGRSTGFGGPQVSARGVMRKDFDSASWGATHGTDYQDLIATARKKLSKETDAGRVSESGDGTFEGKINSIEDTEGGTSDVKAPEDIPNKHFRAVSSNVAGGLLDAPSAQPATKPE
jgi:E3 ubiquitin-protein ligase RAD18